MVVNEARFHFGGNLNLDSPSFSAREEVNHVRVSRIVPGSSNVHDSGK